MWHAATIFRIIPLNFTERKGITPYIQLLGQDIDDVNVYNNDDIELPNHNLLDPGKAIAISPHYLSTNQQVQIYDLRT